MYFATSSLGFAVGAYGLNTLSGDSLKTVRGAPAATYAASISMTLDGGLTYMAVTGVPSAPGITATGPGFSSGNIGQPGGTVARGTAATPISPWPVRGWGEPGIRTCPAASISRGGRSRSCDARSSPAGSML